MLSVRPRKTPMLRVRRQCLVCETRTVVEEVAGTFSIGVPCSSCGAPTERVEILARRTVAAERNPSAAALGRLGGLKGGPARAAALSAARRRAIARAAALTRWAKRRKESCGGRSGRGGEEIAGEVLEAGVDDHRRNDFARTQLARERDGGRDVEAARRADEHSFFARQAPRHRTGVGLGNRARLVPGSRRHVRRNRSGG